MSLCGWMMSSKERARPRDLWSTIVGGEREGGDARGGGGLDIVRSIVRDPGSGWGCAEGSALIMGGRDSWSVAMGGSDAREA